MKIINKKPSVDIQPEKNKKIFNANAKYYTDEIDTAVSFTGLDSDFFINSKVELILELIKNELGNTHNRLILDVGCGTGSHHKGLSESGLKITGIDIAGNPLKIAQQNNSDIKYQEYNGKKIPFKDDSFDITLTINVLHHIDGIQNRKRHVSEMKRVTRKKGLMIIIEHNPYNPLTRLAVFRCPFDKDVKLLTANSARDLLKTLSIQPKTNYFLFLPFSFFYKNNIERKLSWLPLGAQHCTYGIK